MGRISVGFKEDDELLVGSPCSSCCRRPHRWSTSAARTARGEVELDDGHRGEGDRLVQARRGSVQPAARLAPTGVPLRASPDWIHGHNTMTRCCQKRETIGVCSRGSLEARDPTRMGSLLAMEPQLAEGEGQAFLRLPPIEGAGRSAGMISSCGLPGRPAGPDRGVGRAINEREV